MAEYPFPRSYYFTTLRNCSGNRCHTEGRGSRKLMQHLYAQLKLQQSLLISAIQI